MSKRRQQLLEANSITEVKLEDMGWWQLTMCQRRENSVQVGQSESHYGGDNQRRLPKVTGICPKGYRRMQASELLDLKDLKSRKQNYGDSKVHCLNRCTLLIKKSACRLSLTKARSDF